MHGPPTRRKSVPVNKLEFYIHAPMQQQSFELLAHHATQSAAAMDVEGVMPWRLRTATAVWGGYAVSILAATAGATGCGRSLQGGQETGYPGEGVGQGGGVGQQAQLAQQVLQVVPGQDALHHVGAVQAVDAVDAEHANLAF